MAKLKLESLKFEQIMKDYAEIRETTIPNAVHMNARLLCVEFARRTQAFGNDEKVVSERVHKDISNIIKPPIYFLKFVTKTTSARLKKALTKNFQSRNWPALESTLAAVGMGSEAFTIVNSGDMASIHRQNRNSRTGRTFKRPKKFYLAADSTHLHDYIRTRQAQVGLAKSGWASCAKQLRKVVSGSMTRGIPKWVTRHLGDKSLGEVTDHADNPFNPTVTITNKCRYAEAVLPPSQQLQGLSIVHGKMKKQMERILKSRNTKLAEAA